MTPSEIREKWESAFHEWLRGAEEAEDKSDAMVQLFCELLERTERAGFVMGMGVARERVEEVLVPLEDLVGDFAASEVRSKILHVLKNNT